MNNIRAHRKMCSSWSRWRYLLCTGPMKNYLKILEVQVIGLQLFTQVVSLLTGLGTLGFSLQSCWKKNFHSWLPAVATLLVELLQTWDNLCHRSSWRPHTRKYWGCRWDRRESGVNRMCLCWLSNSFEGDHRLRTGWASKCARKIKRLNLIKLL